MDEKVTETLAVTAERLTAAAEALDRVLGRLDAQQEALNAKVDRIVAAVEESEVGVDPACAGDCVCANTELKQRVAELEKSNGELEKSNAELQAKTARLQRKTLSPLVTSLLAKGEGAGEKFEPWLSRIEMMKDDVAWRAAEEIPPTWYAEEWDALEELVRQLLDRRGRVRELITAFRMSARNPFPNWRAEA